MDFHIFSYFYFMFYLKVETIEYRALIDNKLNQELDLFVVTLYSFE